MIRQAIRLIFFTSLAAGCGTTSTPPPASGTSALGGACTATTDCVAGLTCHTDDPGGQCLRACNADADCGSGGVCDTGEHICYRACSADADCRRAGYGCVGGSTGHQFCDPLPPPDAGTTDSGPADTGAPVDASSFEAHPPCNAASDYMATGAVSFGGAVGSAYSPRCVMVHRGSSVTWTGSFSSHPLAAGTGGSASSPVPMQSTGATATATFSATGYFPFYCMVHGGPNGTGMAGVVWVVP